jgi:hypothetical protein
MATLDSSILNDEDANNQKRKSKKRVVIMEDKNTEDVAKTSTYDDEVVIETKPLD